MLFLAHMSGNCKLAEGVVNIIRHRDGLQAHLAHQPPDAFPIHPIALCAQCGGHLWPTVKGRFQILRVDRAHHLEIEWVLRCRLIIVGRTVETEQGALPANAQRRMVRLDQFSLGVN